MYCLKRPHVSFPFLSPRRGLSQKERVEGQPRNGDAQALNPSPLPASSLRAPSFFMRLSPNSPAICFMNVMQTPSAPRTPLFTSSRTNHTN